MVRQQGDRQIRLTLSVCVQWGDGVPPDALAVR